MENAKPLHKTTGILLLIAAFIVMLWQIFIIYTSGMHHVTHGLLLIAGLSLPETWARSPDPWRLCCCSACWGRC